MLSVVSAPDTPCLLSVIAFPADKSRPDHQPVSYTHLSDLPKQKLWLFPAGLAELYKTFIHYYGDSLLPAMLQQFLQIFSAHQLPRGIVGIRYKQHVCIRCQLL